MDFCGELVASWEEAKWRRLVEKKRGTSSLRLWKSISIALLGAPSFPIITETVTRIANYHTNKQIKSSKYINKEGSSFYIIATVPPPKKPTAARSEANI